MENTTFSIGDTVYFTAYLKKDPHIFYICKGRIKSRPEKDIRKYWKVRVEAIGDRPIGGKPLVEQCSLLGTILSKDEGSMSKELSPFMKPPIWVEKRK